MENNKTKLRNIYGNAAVVAPALKSGEVTLMDLVKFGSSRVFDSTFMELHQEDLKKNYTRFMILYKFNVLRDACLMNEYIREFISNSTNKEDDATLVSQVLKDHYKFMKLAIVSFKGDTIISMNDSDILDEFKDYFQNLLGVMEEYNVPNNHRILNNKNVIFK